MNEYLLKGLVFAVLMMVFYYLVTFRKRPDRLAASIRTGAVVGAIYLALQYLLNWYAA